MKGPKFIGQLTQLFGLQFTQVGWNLHRIQQRRVGCHRNNLPNPTLDFDPIR